MANAKSGKGSGKVASKVEPGGAAWQCALIVRAEPTKQNTSGRATKYVWVNAPTLALAVAAAERVGKAGAYAELIAKAHFVDGIECHARGPSAFRENGELAKGFVVLQKGATAASIASGRHTVPVFDSHGADAPKGGTYASAAKRAEYGIGDKPPAKAAKAPAKAAKAPAKAAKAPAKATPAATEQAGA